MKIKTANTILYCKKWREIIVFYRDGLKLLMISSNELLWNLKLNEMSRLSVADETRTSIKSGDGGGITISLQVSDIEQTRAELMAAGIIPTHQPRKYGIPKQYTCVTLKETGLSLGRDG